MQVLHAHHTPARHRNEFLFAMDCCLGIQAGMWPTQQAARYVIKQPILHASRSYPHRCSFWLGHHELVACSCKQWLNRCDTLLAIMTKHWLTTVVEGSRCNHTPPTATPCHAARQCWGCCHRQSPSHAAKQAQQVPMTALMDAFVHAWLGMKPAWAHTLTRSMAAFRGDASMGST